MERIKSSVIGSYPIEIDGLKLIKNYFNGKDSSWDYYINLALNDMMKINLDYISDGQTRDPFINIFCRKIKGCRLRGRIEVINKLEYSKPIILEDIKKIKDIIPKNKGLIGVIAGPYTLSESVVDNYYNNKMKLAFEFAEIIKKEIDLIIPYIDMLSIDEPFFSNYYPDYGKDLIDVLIKNISCPIRLHVCGDVSKIIPELIELSVDILSHEFKAKPKLFDSFKEYSFNKNICLGCVRSDNDKIESINEILAHIKHAELIFEDKIKQISPDCGLRLLPRNVAFKKLENLVKAGEIFNES